MNALEGDDRKEVWSRELDRAVQIGNSVKHMQLLCDERDRWKADADRLAAAAVAYIEAIAADTEGALEAALAAHDALTAETEGK